MPLIPTKLQEVLAALQAKLRRQTEDAYRDRDAASASGDYHAQSYSAGEAHAYSDAAGSVRAAQDEADEPPA